MRTTLIYAALYVAATIIFGTDGAIWGLIIGVPAWAVTLVLTDTAPDPDPQYSALDKMDGRS